MTRYDLKPTEEQRVKNFYGKAYVEVEPNKETLYSYNTKIISRDSRGALTKYWDDWSATTGRHIKAFCDLDKKQYEELKCESDFKINNI